MEIKRLNLEKNGKRKLFKRENADKLLENVIEKIKEVNEKGEFIYYIKKAILFGSYINSDRNEIGDLDIAIYLEIKDNSICEQRQNQQRYLEAGKVNEPFLKQIIFGKEEIAKFIKDKKRILDIHDGARAELEAKYYKDPYCYIYADKIKIIYEFDKEELDCV